MRKARNLIGNLITHNMVQGINREYIFEKNEEKQKYLYLMKKYNKEYKVSIIAYCIMDNHAHLLLHSNDSKNLSLFMKEINTRYALYYNKKKERIGYVFRNRFESKVMGTELQTLRCIKYIHMNPVKAHIVETEDKYQFSSYNYYINQNQFINSKILNSIFNSKKDYLDKLINIQYMDLNLEKEEGDFSQILKQFLEESQFEFENIRENPIIIKKFMAYLISNGYSFTKTELAQVLKMSRVSLYRRLKNE